MTYLQRRQEWLFKNFFDQAFRERKQIEVTYVPSVDYLGTENGTDYAVYPQQPDTDEEGLHGK